MKNLGSISNNKDIPTKQYVDNSIKNGTLTIQKNGTNVQTFTANQSSNVTANITVPTKTSDLTNDSSFITNTGSTTGNAGSATKLETARTIAIGTGATGTATSFNGTANITIPITDVKDAYVTWGGKAMTTLSPDDMGCLDEFGHNKLAFLPATKVAVEYTTDGGTSWLDYGLTNAQKIAMVTTSGPTCVIGKGTASASGGTMTNANCGNYKVRVVLTFNGSLYTICKKVLLNMTTAGASNCSVKVEARTYTDFNAGNDTWRTLGTYTVAGWSGWNSLPVSTTIGGANTWSDAQYRFTLSIGSVNTAYTCNAGLIDFRLIGLNNWNTPSELARAGHLYNVDTDQNALFPANILPKVNNSKNLGNSSYKWANVYATTFTGNLTGTATKATGDKNGDDITTTYYKASNPNGYTSNVGTITGINMNGASKGTSGVVDLGTVLTSHQTIKTINSTSMVGSGDISLPTSSDLTSLENEIYDNVYLKTEIGAFTDLHTTDKTSIVNAINEVNDIVDITNQITWKETVANVKVFKRGKQITFQYQGQAKAHSANAVLAEIPSAYAPSYQVVAPFTKNNNAYGFLSLASDAKLIVGMISSTSASGRIYANFTYYID